MEMVPEDVLALIFICCFEEDRFVSVARAAPYEGQEWIGDRFRVGAPFEMVATCVTRRWRGLAINMARLWSNIFIIPFQSQKTLEIYLARSRETLLDIYFMLDDSYLPEIEYDKEDSLALSLAMVVPHVHRWRRCIIRSYSYPTIEQIVTAVRESTAQNLEHFVMYLRASLSREDLSYSEFAFRSSIFMGGAPRLKYVECIGASIESCWPPTHALTDLRFDVDESYEDVGPPAHPLTSDRFIELLSSVPTLVNLKLRGHVVELRHTDSAVELPHLTSLAIDFDWDGSYATNLCNLISCPALISLKLYQMTEQETIDAIAHVVKDSPRLLKYPALANLEIYDAAYFDINYNFVTALPTVVHLNLSKCTATPTILGNLAKLYSQPNGGDLWPRLQSLTINPYYWYWEQDLHAFLISRTKIVHPLLNLRLNGDDVDPNLFLKDKNEGT